LPYSASNCHNFRDGARDGRTAKFSLFVDESRLSLVGKPANSLRFLAGAFIPEELVDLAFRQVDETLAVVFVAGLCANVEWSNSVRHLARLRCWETEKSAIEAI